MKRYLTASIIAAFCIFEYSISLTNAEVVCSYFGGVATECCDTEKSYCHGFTAYGRQVWEDLQGRWRGKIRLHSNTCQYRNTPVPVQDLDIRVKALTTYDPDGENLLSGRTKAGRYDGYYEPPTGVDDPLASFRRSKPVRMSNGLTCRRQFSIELVYPGGRNARATASQEIRCSGSLICKTVRKGTLRKTTRVARQ